MCASVPKVSLNKGHAGYRRGAYKWSVENLGSLRIDQRLKSDSFFIGSFKWAFLLIREVNGLKVIVVSYNAEPVRADVFISRTGEMKSGDVKRTSCTACPFHCIYRAFFPHYELTDAKNKSQICDSLVVTVDMKNVVPATNSEYSSARLSLDSRIINVEVIDHQSISNVLNGQKTPAVISSDYKRNSDVCSRSYIYFWAQQNPDYRYWLCKRLQDGNVIVKGCLDRIDFLKSFASICNEVRGVPWVTVFKDQKKSDDDCQPIDADTVVIFCILDDPSSDDLLYLGHLLLRKTTPWLELSKRIEDDLIHDDQRYSVHLLEGNITKDITDMSSSLNECGVHSGSAVVARPKPANKEGMSEEWTEEASSLDEPEQASSRSMVSTSEFSNGAVENHGGQTSGEQANSILENTPFDFASNFVFFVSNAQIDWQRVPGEDIQLQGAKTGLLDRMSSSKIDSSSGEKEIHLHKCSSLPPTCGLATDVTSMGEADESVGRVNDLEVNISVEKGEEVSQAFKESQQELVAGIQLKEPIIKEIRQVDTAVVVKSNVTASYQETCNANVTVDVRMEQLKADDAQLSLIDREAQEVFMIPDDFVRKQIFLLDFQKDYRMRIRLAHKHQRDTSSFRIKHLLVKPSDGLELGLETFETRRQTEGSEVVALVQFGTFQSVRLSSKSPQFGTVLEKYVSLPVTIGVESACPKPNSQRSIFELKEQILCRMSAGADI